MSETLRRIVNISSFPQLQEKLEAWLDNYHLNTTSMNVDRCQAAIEATGRLHGQLLDLLRVVDPTSVYSSPLYDPVKYPYSKYYPYYWWRYPYTDYPYTETVITAKNREIALIKDDYESNLATVEDDLNQTQIEADDLQIQLEDTKAELAEEQRKSQIDKMFMDTENADLRAKLAATKKMYEAEIQNIKADQENLNRLAELKQTIKRLNAAEDELATLRSRVGLVSDYERQIRNLRDDIAILTGRRSTLSINGASYDADQELEQIQADLTSIRKRRQRAQRELSFGPNLVQEFEDRIPKARKSNRFSLRRKHNEPKEVDSLPLPYKPLARPGSPFAPDDVTQRVRQSNLIQRYEDLYYKDRVDAMDTLRRFSDDNENNQRIVFSVVVEAFSAAKLAFSSFKQRVRSNLATTFTGPGTLEEATQDYINRNNDLYSLPDLVADVVRALNRNIRISLPADVSYTVIQPFIREASKLAWSMSSLAHPLDVGLATDAELFEDSKYRRSYDSEYTAPLVNHHIWPCLKQGLNVLIKGEACTRRGASLTPRSSRSPSRSLTPSRASSRARSLSPSRSLSRARSRSPSPMRKSRDSVLSGRLSPGRRSVSPSRASCRSVAASTSLSHYGVAS